MCLALTAPPLFCRYPKICVFLLDHRIQLHRGRFSFYTSICITRRDSPYLAYMRLRPVTPCSGATTRCSIGSGSRALRFLFSPLEFFFPFLFFAFSLGWVLCDFYIGADGVFSGGFSIMRAREGDFSTARFCPHSRSRFIYRSR